MVIIVMGVSGCGKSTIARGVGEKLNLPYYDADDFHPLSNIQKMAKGIPLDDTDRQPWLEDLARQIALWQEGDGGVLACSALKEDYRQTLSSRAGSVEWVYLDGSYELILKRISSRANHFMQATMLKSQFEALEVPKYGLHVDISQSITEIIDEIVFEFQK